MLHLRHEEIIFAVISIGNGKFVSLSDYPVWKIHIWDRTLQNPDIFIKLYIHSTPIFSCFLLTISSSYLIVEVFECLFQNMWFINSTLEYFPAMSAKFAAHSYFVQSDYIFFCCKFWASLHAGFSSWNVLPLNISFRTYDS